jgi:hypothetical protein
MHLASTQAGRTARSATMALAALLVALGIAGCAAGSSAGREGAADERVPYVGVLTGEYVDGIPLVRFPTINVVGSRSSVGRL